MTKSGYAISFRVNAVLIWNGPQELHGVCVYQAEGVAVKVNSSSSTLVGGVWYRVRAKYFTESGFWLPSHINFECRGLD